MNIAIIYALGSVILVSLISLVGIFTLTMGKWFVERSISFLVALAIGSMLGDAFIHLIPEAFEKTENAVTVSLLILLGIFLFFVIEKYFHWHHGVHGAEEHHKEHCEIAKDTITDKNNIRPLGRLILVSDGIHNLIDGIIIGASYLISIELGIATTVAVVLHEIPQEIGDFGILIHSGYTRAKALMLNFISALLAVVGVLITIVIGSTSEAPLVWILPIAAGSFIYISSSDLIPELHTETSVKNSFMQIVAIGIGVFAMYLLLFLE